MAWEGRKYKHDKSENFDEYMKALGNYNSTLASSDLFASPPRMKVFTFLELSLEKHVIRKLLLILFLTESYQETELFFDFKWLQLKI